jgi:hypothetical protein
MTFTTTAAPDLTPPIISDTEITSITDKLATIEFNTDELGDTFIDYGLTENLGLSAGSSQDVYEHTITVTNLQPNTQYYFKVGSIDKSGNEKVSDTVMYFTTRDLPDSDAPSSPSGVSIFSGNKELLLVWNLGVESDLAGYNVYRKSGNTFQLIQSRLNDVRYLDTGLINGTIYQYKTAAVDFSGNVSLKSGTITDQPDEINSPTVPVPLSPADGESISNKNIAISVQNSNKLLGRPALTYEFVIAGESDFFNQVAYIDGVTEGEYNTEWTAEVDLEHEKTYYWKARAYDGYFYSSWSDAKTFTADTTLVTSVTLLEFSGESVEATVRLDWKTNLEMNTAGFNILRSLNENSGYRNINDELIEPGKTEYSLIDNNVESGRVYFYKLSAVSNNGLSTEFEPIEIEVKLPRNFALYPNYPNPFNPVTTIKFELPKQERAQLRVYNILGQLVKEVFDEKKKAGYHVVRWDGRDNYGRPVSSGMYIYRLRAGDFIKARKMILIR